MGLLRDNLRSSDARLLGWCLMPNHVHLVAIPNRAESLAVLLRRVHGRYAQYYNALAGRTGHLWQNRYFACMLEGERLWTALAYVDRNPVRAGIARWAADYRWSSARAHVSGFDESALIDMDWWRSDSRSEGWAQVVDAEELQSVATLRQCTFAGRPFGGAEFVASISAQFGRHWERGRPRKQAAADTRAENCAHQADGIFGNLRRSG